MAKEAALQRFNSVAELEKKRQALTKKADTARTGIYICGGTGCRALGAQNVINALHEELVKQGLTDKVSVTVTGCRGFCEQGPLLVIEPAGILYHTIKPEDVPEIVTQTVAQGKQIERLLYLDPQSG